MLFPIFTLSWRVNNCVSRQRKGINKKNETAKIQFSLLLSESTDDNNQYNFFSKSVIETVKNKLISFHKEDNLVLIAVYSFSRRDGQL